MKQYKSKNLLFIIPIMIFVFSFLYLQIDKATKVSYAHGDKTVTINNIPVTVMIADDLEEQWQGLSDRISLGHMNGMLFVFPTFQERTFVMRRMNFPLDIIWIRENRIVKIDRMLEPEWNSPKMRYHSKYPVNYVLEVNGGMSDAFGFRVGDRVNLSF